MKQIFLLLFAFAAIGVKAQIGTIPTITGSNSGDGEIKLIVAAAQSNDDYLETGGPIDYTDSTAVITVLDADSIATDAILYTDTYWDDIRVPLTNTFLNPSKSEPAFEDMGDGIFVFAFDTGNDSTESLHFIVQVPHSYKEGTDIDAHIHWAPSSTNTDDVVWKLFYKIAPNGHETSAFSAIDSIRVVTAANGTALSQQITELGSVDGTNIKVSTIIIGNITRLGDAPADDFTGIVYGLEIDFHYQIDSPGSTYILVK